MRIKKSVNHANNLDLKNSPLATQNWQPATPNSFIRPKIPVLGQRFVVVVRRQRLPVLVVDLPRRQCVAVVGQKAGSIGRPWGVGGPRGLRAHGETSRFGYGATEAGARRPVTASGESD